MAEDYWFRQTAEKPLFEDLLWSRPENKRQAGKLLIVGGNAHGFSVVAQAYNEALKAGAGSVRLLLPDRLEKVIGSSMEAEFAPSTPSGSFNQKALAEFLELSNWADGILIAGELGRNAETAAVIEKFLAKTDKQVTITRDAVNYFYASPKDILERDNTTVVLSMSQLQKLAKEARYPEAVMFSMDLLRLVDWLRMFTDAYKVNVVVKHLGAIFVAVNGKISTTKLKETKKIWRVDTAARCAVWWLQNPQKTFEALSTALIIK